MSLKFERLRLSGFKSFVDNTELLIEPGLTGIVGPNGCGKSNVLEGLRWVMGATSAKALRGTGMEDVIFAGTSGRPARNVAEVSVLLDNSERQAPAAFNDSDKIEVVRRIERDAGSAYRINGKDVRARDVQLLFADASTGSNSPALVRQGQISELINAKPENRRKLLEQAAGIAGLHSRRHEAELRLKAAESNLTRLEDVEQQLEEQLTALKRQVRQANRYRNLSGHIRKAEAIGLYIRWTQARDSLAQAESELRAIEALVEEKTRETAQASTAQAEAAAALPPLREAEARAAAAVQRLNVERDNLDREEARAREQAEALENQIAQIHQDSEREHGLMRDADQVVARLKEEKESLEARQAAQEQAIETARTAVQEVRDQLTEKESRLDRLTRQLAELNARKSALEHTLEDARARLATLEDQLSTSRRERDEIKRTLNATQHHADIEARLAAAREKVAAAEDAAREADRARLDALAEEKQARLPLEEAERTLNKLKAEAKALSDLLKVSEGDLWPPVVDALKVAAGYETALGAALGDDLNVPADEAAPIHWDCLEGEAPGARPLPPGARPMSDYVEGPAALTRRLSQIGLVEKADGKRLQKQLAVGQRLVSLEGDVWRWDGFTATSEAETMAARRLSQRNRLAELDEEIERTAREVEACQNEVRAASDKVAACVRQEEAARAAWKTAQDELAAVREAKAEMERANAETRSRLAALDESEKRLVEALTDLQQRRQTTKEELAALDDAQALAQEIAAARSGVEALRARLSEATAAYEGERREAHLARQRLQNIAVELDEWQTRLEAAESQIADLETRRQETQAQLEEVRRIPAGLEQQRLRLLEAINNAEQTRAQAADALAEAEAIQRRCDAHLREAEKALSEAREQRARIEAVLDGARERLQEVIARVHETLDCSPEALKEKAEIDSDQDLPSLDQIEATLERLKRERDNMGAVNLRAAEEAEELRARLDEMEQERADLEGAIAKLRRGIASLNREGRARLLSAFERVNEHFGRLFGVLFEGGTAKLELTESDDPLSAGLEIFARPPGKRLQSMSLMSGGEQSLTAVALIFAVFLSNPAPICFLDEVEAALDDSNVERFCNLLDEMVRLTDTRFLIITHHALTMSRMDRLYGVTMAERGISQLVSVDLSSAEQIREAG